MVNSFADSKEDLGSFPTVHIGWLTIPYKSESKGSSSFHSTCILQCAHRHTQAHTHKINENKKVGECTSMCGTGSNFLSNAPRGQETIARINKWYQMKLKYFILQYKQSQSISTVNIQPTESEQYFPYTSEADIQEIQKSGTSPQKSQQNGLMHLNDNCQKN